MKNSIKNTLRTGAAAVFGLMALYACSDDRNSHFNDGPTYEATAIQPFDGTAMQALEEEASDFAEIVKAVGFDVYLNSSSSYTIWAPANGTYNKDSVLNVLANSKDLVLKQFVQNHVARYSVPLDLESHHISLLNGKGFTMTGKSQHKIGDVNISSKNNIRCNNGILHILEGNLPFQSNIFEFIELEYLKSTNPTKEDISLYAYLKTADKDSLDESRSIYRGYDAYGNKLWVDSVVWRNNTILRDFNALIYEEDSNYIALVPSVEAYQGRYNEALPYLKYNPSMDKGLEYKRTDSLTNSYANRFAMTDLFYSRNMNESWEDSLISTQYLKYSWPDHLYYRKEPANLPDDKKVNDILAKVGVADSIVCSNGIAYRFNEYPFDIYEQFLKKINMNTLSLRVNYISPEEKIKGSEVQVTKNVGDPDYQSGIFSVVIYETDEEGERVEDENGNPIIKENIMQNYSYIYVPASSKVNTYIGFNVPNNFSGKYDIYVITMPIWFYKMEAEGLIPTNKKAYNFRAWMWEKDESGNYPSGGIVMKDDEGKQIFTTPEPVDIRNIRDTTYIGSYEFKYAYYGENEPGVILQIATVVGTSQRDKYSYDMMFHGIVLKPHREDITPAAKKHPLKTYSVPVKGTATLGKGIKKILKR